MKNRNIIAIPDEEARLRRRIRRHLKQLGFTKGPNGSLEPPSLDKQSYRDMHAHQRHVKLVDNAHWIQTKAAGLIRHFASGAEIDVRSIRPRIEVVHSGTWQSELFRLATYYWKIPVSDGYGRRIRFLVWDDMHERLIGILALGDAVFNLKARDDFIGWDHHRRSEALVNLMDAYVLGALPPYNMLLGGKLVASLVQTREVVDAFLDKYRNSVGIISGECKKPALVAVTTTSALGRSSIYNRLRIGGHTIFQPIGYSSGWGHFHFSDALFEGLRSYLETEGDAYADSHAYGQGPNYRLRVIKKALVRLGMKPQLAHHGLAREVFFAPMASNALQMLRGEHKRANYRGLQTVQDRGEAALNRWVIPRSERFQEFRQWTPEQLLQEINGRNSHLQRKKNSAT